MRKLLILGALLVPLALFAGADGARPCNNGGLIGLKQIDLPAGVPTPGGHTATAVYIDDRAQGTLGPLPVASPTGLAGGDGTWIYFETNGQPGLQRGGHGQLPTTPLTGEDVEFAACSGANPDELLL